MRGIDSIANATTPRRASLSMPAASVSGERKPIRTVPAVRASASAGLGAPTRRTPSAPSSRASRSTTVVPASMYASSRQPAAAPAPRSTATSKPAETSRPAVSGTSATLRSPSALSRGTTTLIARECRERTGRAGRERPAGRESSAVDTLAALTAAVEARHPHQRGHSARVTVYAEALARRLRWSPRMLDELRLGCALHDVGKLAVPEDVLTKQGALSPQDEAALRRHPVEGARLIAGTEAFRRALPYVLYHHERWDGGGYPSGRAGEEIPLQARLLAVADAFDAMVSSRPHRPALPV